MDSDWCRLCCERLFWDSTYRAHVAECAGLTPREVKIVERIVKHHDIEHRRGLRWQRFMALVRR